MNQKRILAISVPVFMIIMYLAGPKPEAASFTNELPVVPSDASALTKYIASNESLLKLRPGNEARIIWANDSSKTKTDYAIVYLHGFSASQEEGAPVHKEIAKKFGCNLYLARLSEHGKDTVDKLINLTANSYWNSVKEAYAIGKQLGDKVILMGTSTGGSHALHLASVYPDVYGIILLSPNIEIRNQFAWLGNNPWGLQIGRMVVGSKYVTPKNQPPIYSTYWDSSYRLEAVASLQEYLETVMIKETFEKIKQPALMLYYYRDEIHQDSVVKVEAMLKMFDQLGTPVGQKKSVAVPNAGDHVIGSYIKSKDLATVENEIITFMEKTLKMKRNMP
jgi:esterase/lipase